MAGTKVVVAPEPGVPNGWLVSEAFHDYRWFLTRTASQRDAIGWARQQLKRLGGGLLEVHTRTGRTRYTRTHSANHEGSSER
jgi:hypothetical protein